MIRFPSAGCGVVWLFALVAGSSVAVGQPLGFTEHHLLLESAGINAALLDKFTTGKPLADDDRAAQLAALSSVKQVTHYYLERFAEQPKNQEWIASGRGMLWDLRGRLESITPLDLTDEELSQLYPEIDEPSAVKSTDPRRKIFRCEAALDDGLNATALAIRMPEKLLVAKPGERVGLQGVYLKNAGTAEAPHPVIFVNRPAWYAATYLGDLGMDYAQFDDVRDVTADLKYEQESLYRLLAAMRKADQSKLFAEGTANYDAATKSFSVVPLFNDPAAMRGKLATLAGTARRAVAVLVNEPDVQERFGITKYYQVAIYTIDSQQNPILFDLLELPPGFPEGENIHAQVKIPGTLLTGYYYKRDATPDEQSRNIKPELQKAPLLVGRSLEYLPQQARQESYWQWIFALLVSAAFLVLTIAVWRMTKSERRTREILQQQQAPPAGTSLNDADVELQPPLDFSKIDVEKK